MEWTYECLFNDHISLCPLPCLHSCLSPKVFLVNCIMPSTTPASAVSCSGTTYAVAYPTTCGPLNLQQSPLKGELVNCSLTFCPCACVPLLVCRARDPTGYPSLQIRGQNFSEVPIDFSSYRKTLTQ